MSTKTLKNTLPPPLSNIQKEIDKFRTAKRPRLSRVLRQLVYAYVKATLPREKPTQEEKEIFREGREEFDNGEFITLEDWENELAHNRNKKSTKGNR